MKSTPYSGTPAPFPGMVQAEAFDSGGEGVAFHKVRPAPVSAAIRGTMVYTETTGDTLGGYDVGYINAGEWLAYTVSAVGGTYSLGFRVSCPGDGGTFHLEVDGVNVTGPLKIPNTGNWQVYATVNAPGIILSAGTRILRVVFDAAGNGGAVGNFNWLQGILLVPTPAPTPSPTPAPTTSLPRLWDFLGLVHNGIPIYVSGVGTPPDIKSWAANAPLGIKWAVMDIEGLATMDMGNAGDVYTPGGRGAADVSVLASAFAEACNVLPGAAVGTTAIIPNNASFNADYAYNGAGNTRWVYNQLAACAAAYKQASFIAVECYIEQGQSTKEFFALAGQWIGMASQLGVPVIAVVQPDYPGTVPPVTIPADLFGMIVRYLASLCSGVCVWGSPESRYRAGYLASPAVAWLSGRVAADGTLDLFKD